MVEQTPYRAGPDGDDLALIALHHAKRAARRHRGRTARTGWRPQPQPRSPRPVSLAVAMVEMAEYVGWPVPVDTTVVRQWPALAGSLSEHLSAVSFDSASGILRLRGKSLAWTTQGRLLANQIAQRVNEAIRSNTVSRVVVLPPEPAGPSAPEPAPAWVPYAFAPAAPAPHQDVRLANTLRQLAESAPHEPTHLFPASTERPTVPPADVVWAKAAARARADRDRLT
ncbi:hypothetical protein ABZ705_28315 [Streptomyces sp. NPDC006984]|uniref:hypothetical protein n=1 Tax=Streptomyces sp. NPDC006984 TaxID=3155463 RepID=UPI0033EF6924